MKKSKPKQNKDVWANSIIKKEKNHQELRNKAQIKEKKMG